jgi:hypothetical protein
MSANTIPKIKGGTRVKTDHSLSTQSSLDNRVNFVDVYTIYCILIVGLY